MAQSNFFQQEYLRKNTDKYRPVTEDKKNYRSITIEDHSPKEVFQFFRNLENLSLFMKGIKSVRVESAVRSHWTVQLKSGAQVEWDAEIVNESPDSMIAWRSLPDAKLTTSGSIWFSQALRGNGTIVNLTMDYELPGGKITELVTLFTGEDPDSLALTNLHRLKAYLETGEVPTTEGQPSGRESINFDTKMTRH